MSPALFLDQDCCSFERQLLHHALATQWRQSWKNHTLSTQSMTTTNMNNMQIKSQWKERNENKIFTSKGQMRTPVTKYVANNWTCYRLLACHCDLPLHQGSSLSILNCNCNCKSEGIQSKLIDSRRGRLIVENFTRSLLHLKR